MMTDIAVDDLFRVRIQQDFNINRYADTGQQNLPTGYYRKLYLDLLGGRLVEDSRN